jgi:hypothetical protein
MAAEIDCDRLFFGLEEREQEGGEKQKPEPLLLSLRVLQRRAKEEKKFFNVSTLDFSPHLPAALRRIRKALSCFVINDSTMI